MIKILVIIPLVPFFYNSHLKTRLHLSLSIFLIQVVALGTIVHPLHSSFKKAVFEGLEAIDRFYYL